MNKNSIAVSVLIIVIAGIVGAFLLHRHVNAPVMSENDSSQTDTSAVDNNPTVVFSCPDNKSISVTFHLPEDTSVDAVLSDGRTLSLNHAISADGARYTNADESIVLWNKGDSVFLNEGNTTTYSDCIASED